MTMHIQKRVCIYVVLGGTVWMVIVITTFGCFGPYQPARQSKRDDLDEQQTTDQNAHVNTDLPKIFLITPTHNRPVQKAELTRISHTLMLVRNVHWIVIEDSAELSELVENVLRKSKLSYTHLCARTPGNYKLGEKDPNWLKPRGVLQRNTGLDWIRNNVNPLFTKGVLYFADDDNTYDLEIFEEMRYTQKVSVWPVGLVAGLWYERPIVEKGKVTGWYTYWKPNRPFAMDMAGFAINIQLLFDFPNAKFDLSAKRGYQESAILSKLVTMDQLEPKASKCTKILVWHTRTQKADLRNEKKFHSKDLPGSDLTIEV